MREIDPDPLVEIHPETVASHSIGNGEWMWIENWMGRARYKAKLTRVVPKWMIMASHGWRFPEKEAAEPSLFGVWESNINQLIPMNHQGKVLPHLPSISHGAVYPVQTPHKTGP